MAANKRCTPGVALHLTEIDNGVSRLGCTTFTTDARKALLSQFRFRVNERFLYEYDFGDLWQHQIRTQLFRFCCEKAPSV